MSERALTSLSLPWQGLPRQVPRQRRPAGRAGSLRVPGDEGSHPGGEGAPSGHLGSALRHQGQPPPNRHRLAHRFLSELLRYSVSGLILLLLRPLPQPRSLSLSLRTAFRPTLAPNDSPIAASSRSTTLRSSPSSESPELKSRRVSTPASPPSPAWQLSSELPS